MGRVLVLCVRPHQWVKNLFVSPAPLFGHALTHFEGPEGPEGPDKG